MTATSVFPEPLSPGSGRAPGRAPQRLSGLRALPPWVTRARLSPAVSLRPDDPVTLALAATISLSLFFMLSPRTDVAVSALFFSADGFALSQEPLLRALRKSSSGVLGVMLSAQLAVVVIGLYRSGGRLVGPARRAAVLLAGLALGSGLVVNGLLKSVWGRARPMQIEAFGGEADFTPAWWISDNCVTNCSFVSGEASSALWMVAVVVLMAPVAQRRWALPLVLAYGGALSLNRLAFGAHFLSDILLSWALTGLVLALLHRLMLARPAGLLAPVAEPGERPPGRPPFAFAQAAPAVSARPLLRPNQASTASASIPVFDREPAAVRARLTVVVPTFNERRNLTALLRKLHAALAGLSWRIIVVDDDSVDGTARLARRHALRDPRIQCLHRIGRRGLAGAVIEGVMASPDRYVAVIDGDLQHDERLIPAMLARIQAEDADVVIASRFLDAEEPIEGLSAIRLAGSRLATSLGRKVLRARVTDPMSGFFVIRRDVVEAAAPRLSTDGFKVLFDIIASSARPLRILELPYRFGNRVQGRSKMDRRAVLDYLGLLIAKLSHDLISPRMVGFLMVGASGVLVHLGVLRGLLFVGFTEAQFIAAATAMTTNYALNNSLTYRDRRKRGAALLTGYLRFCLVCSLGLAANVAVATLVREHGEVWWLAGLAGAAVGALWNYVASSLIVWR